MSLLGFYGFNHCKTAVDNDGVSPVNGVGPDTWGYTSLVLSGNSATAPAGVVSDTAQAMGKAPKRQPLVLSSGTSGAMPKLTLTASFPASNWPAVNSIPGGGTHPMAGLIVGFRVKATLDPARTSNTLLFTISSGTYDQFTVGPVGLNIGAAGLLNISTISVNVGPSISVDTPTINLADGNEHFVEIAYVISGFNGVVNPRLDLNITVDSVLQFRRVYVYISRAAYGDSFPATSITGTLAGATGLSTAMASKLALTDIYFLDPMGASPYNSPLGSVKVLGLDFDKVTLKGAVPSPSTVTAAEALAVPGDNETVQTDDTYSTLALGFNEAPTGLDSTVLASQAFIVTSVDTGYNGPINYNEGTSSAAGTPVSITMSGATPVYTVGAVKTTLNDGTALTANAFTEYQMNIDLGTAPAGS